ncbi:hypothetical protein [Streptomyces sp. NPDC053755]|uniref:DUF7144 family membrane protein n=1 Tax=Streptomyces sp. NPDC053755 TaxID=3155815 RepID=UPI003441ADE9
MSQNTAPRKPGTGAGAAWAAGGTLFAGVLMLVIGIMDVFQGIAGIAQDDIYADIGDYVFEFNLTTWGWIHLILGIIVAVTGFAILRGSDAGRVAGLTLAVLNAVAHFLFIPYQPWWSLLSIAVSIFVIWALATYDDAPGRGGAAAR